MVINPRKHLTLLVAANQSQSGMPADPRSDRARTSTSETNPYGRVTPCAQVTALAPDGFAITFQNGIGNVGKLQASLPPERARRLEHGQHSTPRGGPAGARRPARRGEAYWFRSS
jgi:hypothetical protein